MKWENKVVFVKNCCLSASFWHLMLWLRQMLKVHCPVPHQYLNFPAGVSWGISLGTLHGKICKQMDLCAPTVFQGTTEVGVLSITIGIRYSPVQKWSTWNSLIQVFDAYINQVNWFMYGKLGFILKRYPFLDRKSFLFSPKGKRRDDFSRFWMSFTSCPLSTTRIESR